MTKFGWGTPTLISLSLGIIIEVPGNFAIVGKLTVAIPDERAPLIIIQVAFIGAIEFNKKRGWLFAILYDSRVIYMTLEGGMGVLAAFGSDANFIVTVGGFHPSYNPPALPFPDIPRIAINILNTPVAKVIVTADFAVTSNTVQFGAHANLYLGSDCQHRGPYRLRCSVPVLAVLFHHNHLGIAVGEAVRGRVVLGELPRHAGGYLAMAYRGTGSISLLLWDVHVAFSSMGDKETRRSADRGIADPLGRVRKGRELDGPLENKRPARHDADGRFLHRACLHPVGTLAITQRAVPPRSRSTTGSQRPS